MPCLNVKESKKFLRDVEEGLKHPSYPIPTPRVDKAIEKILADKGLKYCRGHTMEESKAHSNFVDTFFEEEIIG